MILVGKRQKKDISDTRYRGLSMQDTTYTLLFDLSCTYRNQVSVVYEL